MRHPLFIILFLPLAAQAAERSVSEKLYEAVEYRSDLGQIRRLLDQGADPDWRQPGNVPPGPSTLMRAAILERMDVLDLLLQRGGRFDLSDPQARQTWATLALNGRIKSIDFLIEKTKADINHIDLKDPNGRTALMSALGSTDTLKALIERGARLEVANGRGETALHLAAWTGNAASLRFLLAMGAKANAQDQNGRTPLHVAAEMGKAEAVGALLKGGAKVDLRKRGRYGTPLGLAAGQGRLEAAKLLLEAGANPNFSVQASAKDPEDISLPPLFAAVDGGNWQIVKLLLEKGADPNFALPNGWTALKAAQRGGHAEAVRLLLEKGASAGGQPQVETQGLKAEEARLKAEALKRVYGEGMKGDLTELLFSAAQQGQAEVVRALLDKGADPKAKKSYGETVLMAAAGSGSVETVRLLIDRGADVNADGQSQGNALLKAIQYKQAALVALLLERGADPGLGSVNGFPPLVSAVGEDSPEIVSALLAKGAPVDARDYQGQTPLMWAAQAGRTEIARLLLDKGADVEAQPEKGCAKASETPLHLKDAPNSAAPRAPSVQDARIAARPWPCRTPLMMAAAGGHLEIVKLLLSRRAKVDAKSVTDGSTALIEAAKLGDPRVVRALLAGGADPALRDSAGKDALSWAEERSNTKAAAPLKAAKTKP